MITIPASHDNTPMSYLNFGLLGVDYYTSFPFLSSTETPTMSTPTRRRLMRDFKRLQSDPPGK